MPGKQRGVGFRPDPLFSIVTVVRNGVETLERTIHSVAAQDFDGYEYILLDGASTDGTREVIRSNAEHVSLWRSEPDQGVYDAMNKALALCHGEYVHFLNCGDYFAEPDVLSLMARALTATKADVVYGDVYDTWKTEERIDRQRINEAGDLLYKTICHQAIFASRRAFGIVGGFDMRYAICADREWLLRAALRHGLALRHVDVPVCVFDNCGGLSSSERFRNLKRRENWRINVRYFPLRSIGLFLSKVAGKTISGSFLRRPASRF